MKITNWENYDALEEELAIKEVRKKTYSKKKKKKGYEKNEEVKRNKKTGKLWINHPNRI
jgi:hypothetical protein